MYAVKYSIKTKTLLTAITVSLAVVLPQILHLIGGENLGQTWLPMQLPILLSGFIAGPAVGAVAGAVAPIVSILLSGMPSAAILPFMAVELCCYGLFSGLLATKKMPSAIKLLSVQVIGRAARAAMLFAVGGNVATVITATTAGICGILLQFAVILPVLYKCNETKDR